jgi:acyl-CoA thioester hydrolase
MKLPLRIYYEDTDFSGAVYHARYLHFFERGRTETLRDLGIDQRALFEAEAGPEAFVVRRMTLDFLKPARMDDLVEIETRITRLGGATIEMHQTLSHDGELLCVADVTIAHLRRGKPARMAEAIRKKLGAINLLRRTNPLL